MSTTGVSMSSRKEKICGFISNQEGSLRLRGGIVFHS